MNAIAKMPRRKIRDVFLVAALFATVFVQQSRATILPPGGFFPGSPEPNPNGGALIATLTDPFANSVMSGSVVSSVISGDTSNPFGGLTFTYSFNVDASSTHAASEFTAASFGLLATDVSFNPAFGGLPPTLFSRSVDGEVIRAHFILPEVMPGLSSALLVVQTSAQYWGTGMGAVIDGQSVNVDILSPAVVPEPTTVIAGALMLLPFGFQGVRYLRNRKAHL